MTPEHKEKIRAARLAKVNKEPQVVVIDDKWKVIRVDDSNWRLEYKGEFRGFYGRLTSALEALPARMLDETASGSLALVLRNVNEIKETIRKAVNPV